MSTSVAPKPYLQTTEAARLRLLRVVVFLVMVGHIVVGLMFWFAPELAIDEILQWGPPSGWTTIIGSYDLSVAFALFLALRDPSSNRGIVQFVGVLLILHGLTHLYYTVIGDSPVRFYLVVTYLVGAGIALLWLAPRQRYGR